MVFNSVLTTLVIFLTTGIPSAYAGSALSDPFYRFKLSNGQIIRDTLSGYQLMGASTVSARSPGGWVLAGVADFDGNGIQDTLLWNPATGGLELQYYGSSSTLGSVRLASPGWLPKVVADINLDGHPDIVFINNISRQVVVYFYGGANGSALLSSGTICPQAQAGWNIVGAADINRDGIPDLIWQNTSTRQVTVNYLGGVNGITITGWDWLNLGGSPGWTVIGAEDYNGDDHPDLIYSNDSTGQISVNYFGGPKGTNFLGSGYLDSYGSLGWKAVVPAKAPIPAPAPSTLPVVLLYNGAGTSPSDVVSLQGILSAMGLNYTLAQAPQLEAMSLNQLLSYRLLLVPGGNSIEIGHGLSSIATQKIYNAVLSYGLNYLGICAGGFFGGYSIYNGLNLTSGVWFNFFEAEQQGILDEAVELSSPDGSQQSVVWWDGPQLSGWGDVVAKYPDGTPAIAEDAAGQGYVVLSGVHPEAPLSWRYGLGVKDPLDADYALASSLIEAALTGTPLPHF